MPPPIIETECPKCAALITLTINEPHCVNHLLYSSIIISHEKGVECPACGSYYVIAVTNANIDYTLLPAPKPADAPVVVPAHSLPRLVGH